MAQLNYKDIGEGGTPLLILHGLFGSLDNWKTPGKYLAQKRRVITVDQRNHGRSFWSNEFNYDILADDLKGLVDELQLTSFHLMGHSMGGKTAMRFAQKYPEHIDQLVSVDMGIKAYPMHHELILKGLNALNLNEISSRGEAEQALSEYIDNLGVRQFLLKNLYWVEKGQLGWRINIPVLEQKMPEILQALPDSPTVDCDALFIYGGQSNYIVDADKNSIRTLFPKAKFIEIKEAGHWIHAETPELFLQTVDSYLQ